jgi:methylmalonyl-CoA/ethylmalonyl-CoA epimerase
MDASPAQPSFNSQFAQIAWVVKDVATAVKFFESTMGINNFGKPGIIRAKDYEGTYYGEPSDGESLVAQAYSGGTFIELIQPLSGNSIFHDYLDKNPSGGIQHVAYRIPVAALDQTIADYSRKGYQIVSGFDTPIARIVFFDTSKEIGVFTEVMGITKEGEMAIEKMKGK